MLIIAEVSPKLAWYIARSSGIVSWLLLSASVIWGLLLSARVLNRVTAPGWLLDLHRFLGALSIVFVAIHIAGLVADNWTHFGWSETLVPMASKWRPAAVSYGVVAFYLLLAIEATSLIRSHIPRKVWRATHYLSFPLFILTTVHGLQTGRDVHTRAYEWITIIVITATMVVLIMRIVATRDSRHRRAGGVSAGHETGAELAA